MTNQIVTVSVAQTVAPAPSTLQKTGAFISQGATTAADGASVLLTEMSDLTAVLRGALALSALAWSGGTVTATTAAPHGIGTGTHLDLTIAGATPSAYNGTYACTITGASAFTYAKVSDPGVESVPGTYARSSVAELLSMATTFFAQGSQQAVYVLELGPGDAEDGVAALDDWITENPGVYYSYLVPRAWSDEATYLTFLAGFESTTSKTYFFTTMTLDNYTDFTDLMKCVFPLIEAPNKPAAEFSLAAPFWVTLNYAPSSTNKITPTAFSYLFGVTAYPAPGNSALLATLKAASINVVGTGAEGGITNTILLWGTTKDGNDFTYWYSVDWVQINLDLAISAAIINGSNNPTNPLYYNQDGINRLQAVAAATMASGVSFGLVLGQPVQTALGSQALAVAIAGGQFNNVTDINAVPFVEYSRDNPNDFRAGRYAGLSAVYTPSRGFLAIVFNLNVTQFVNT